MALNEYELTLIIRPDLDDAVTYGLVEKLEAAVVEQGGTLLQRDDWGKRKLAYPIQRQLKGHYVLLDFAAEAGAISELERRTRNQDNVLRFLTVRIGESIDLEARRIAADERKRQREEEERQRAAAEASRVDSDLDDDDDDDDDRMDV